MPRTRARPGGFIVRSGDNRFPAHIAAAAESYELWYTMRGVRGRYAAVAIPRADYDQLAHDADRVALVHRAIGWDEHTFAAAWRTAEVYVRLIAHHRAGAGAAVRS